MKKLLLIGGGTLLLLLAILFGALFAGPFFASARSGQSASATPSTTNPYCQQFQQDLAHRLGVSVSTLQQDRKGAFEDTLAQMVKDGKLTQSQADAIKARVESRQPCTGKDMFAARGFAKQIALKYLPDLANQVAQGLHLSVAQLQAQVQSGKSLSDIATAQHVSFTQLQTLVTNAIQSELNKAVSNGDLTQQQASMITQRLQQNSQFLSRLLNAHFGKGMRHDFPFAQGF
jgi:polyhydroxyalkanoate synthesis regulator phasin